MLDEKSSTPLYLQLANILKTKIFSDVWKEGDMIPSEAELTQKFGVSRGTVRLAISQLTQDNLLYRKRGKGSFVLAPKIQQSLNDFYDFSDSFKATGLELKVRVTQAEVQVAPQPVLTKLQLEPGSRVFWIERLLTAQGEPLISEQIFLLAELFPGLLEKDLTKKNLYELFAQHYAIKVERAQESFEIVEACRHESHFFGDHQVPLLQHTRITFSQGHPFEYRRSTVRGDICVYHVELEVS